MNNLQLSCLHTSINLWNRNILQKFIIPQLRNRITAQRLSWILSTLQGVCVCVLTCTTPILKWPVSIIVKAMPWLSQLVIGLSLHRPGFNTRPGHVRFVVTRVAFRQLFSEYCSFALSISLHWCPMLPFHSTITDAISSDKTESTVKKCWCHLFC